MSDMKQLYHALQQSDNVHNMLLSVLPKLNIQRGHRVWSRKFSTKMTWVSIHSETNMLTYESMVNFVKYQNRKKNCL